LQKNKFCLQINGEIEEVLNKNQKLAVFRIIQESLNNVIKHAKAKIVSIYIKVYKEIVELIVWG
jgi:two-component system sensor histidine kinase DegS